jgi:hypothetical protein
MDKGRLVALRVRARPAAAAREPPRPPAVHTPWARWESQASEAAPPRPQRPVLLGFPTPHCSMLLNTIQSIKPSSVV